MAMILTMVWGALHGHLVPWCWEDSFIGLSKISMIGHSMCCYWTKPSSSKSLWTTAVSVVSSSRKIFPIVAYSHIQSHTIIIQFSSVQFSRSVMSDSLWPHELQHARPLCPPPTPRVHSNSRTSSRWCHTAISSSVVPFSSCPQSLPASESFPMNQLSAWGGQSIGVSALAPVLPKNTQGWSPLEWTGWISFSPRHSQESSPTPQFKSINSSALSFLHSPTLTSIYDH